MEKIQEKYELWLKYVFEENEKLEIENLYNKQDWQELDKRLNSKLSFGTAGLREVMQAGFAYMNCLTVCQTAQGLAEHILKEKQNGGSVVIGYDGRHNSEKFAKLSAKLLLGKGIRVHLFSEVVPTPFVSYAVTLLSATAGVMVTASHNPKEYNGYKVYWENGSQIIEPRDKTIKEEIEKNQEPWKEIILNHSLLDKSNTLLSDPTNQVEENYYRDCLEKFCQFKDQNAENTKDLKIVFTPMHGVGQKWAEKIFSTFELNPFINVIEQMKPDPEFPTVKFPNPEEGKGSLKLAIETADKNGASIILANDPDSDRFCVSEKVDGKWKLFNGNEIGIILASWCWDLFKQKNPNVDPKDCVFLSSAVSSKMLKKMAEVEGFHYEETLTGFKWLGSRADQLKKEGKHIIFAFEESIGYMIGDLCWDKDGIRTAGVFAEMAGYLKKTKSQRIFDYLNDIYKKYGFFSTLNGYVYCYDPVVMKTLFDEIRNGGKYASSCGDFPISHIRDLTGEGYDSRVPNHKPSLPVSNSTQMITFYFNNGAEVTLRGSGTEPKLKYYIELNGERNFVLETLPLIRKDIIDFFLQPKKYNLVLPKEEGSFWSNFPKLIFGTVIGISVVAVSYLGYKYFTQKKENKN